MKMDYILKKMANFFNFFPCILEKMLKLIIVWSSLEKSVNIFHPVLYEQFHV